METKVLLEQSFLLSITESCDRAAGLYCDSRVSLDYFQINDLTEEGFLSELPPLQLKLVELNQQHCN
jgi:hypothetical protein